eukprot:363049-Chlamydomonas_euryale.AAC.12
MALSRVRPRNRMPGRLRRCPAFPRANVCKMPRARSGQRHLVCPAHPCSVASRSLARMPTLSKTN